MKHLIRVIGTVLRSFLLLTACVMIAVPVSANAFSNVYVFGDSLLDVGNVYIATSGATPLSPPYYKGRFSNGPLAIDLFAANYGVTLAPSVLGGTDYAWGGARAASTIDTSVPDTIDQVNSFYMSLGGASADPAAIYVLDGGGNDIMPALQSLDPNAYLLGALAAMQQSVQILLNAGAQNILLFNVPDVGLTPAITLTYSSTVSAAATALTQQYNQGIWQIVQGYDAAGYNVLMADLFGFNHDVFANPAAYGFTNVTLPCLNGTVCADPDAYFYWDTFHPTAHTGRLLAAELTSAVPEPTTLLLLGLGLIGLVRLRRFRN